MSLPNDFRVVALVAAYNEVDIVGQVVADLIEQGVQVYLLDDGSTDETMTAVEPYLGRGVIGIERLADTIRDRDPSHFEWERILLRKTALARTLDANWFIHHDADEFRESPWPNITLRDALARVDALGYNAVDFASFDFWPVDDSFKPGDDVRRTFQYCSERARHDRLQIKCWKKALDIDLVSSGGHDATFEGRRVFPLRFILRHYPIRGQAHGERNVFQERHGRFLGSERERGWHVQFAAVAEGDSFIRDRKTLMRYDPDAIRLMLAIRNRNVEALELERDTLRDDLRRIGLTLAQRDDEARMAQIEHDALVAEVDRLRSALRARLSELDHLERAAGALRRRVDDLEESLSWRWTAPARAVYRLLGGK